MPKFNRDYGYGRLSGRNIDELLATTRALDGQESKHNPADFALWKKPRRSTSCTGRHHGAKASPDGTSSAAP